MENDKIFLGKIKEIHQYKLVLSLPHRKTGICQLSDVSKQFQTLITSLTKPDDDTEESDESIPSLSDIFSVGQTVHAKLVKLSGGKIYVSLLPSDINCNINFKHIKTGMKIQVAIQSREDKGYILETGISGLNGFLPFTNCSNLHFKIGQLLEVSPIDIKGPKQSSGQRRVTQFSVNNESLKPSILTSSTPIDFHCILPGMLIKTHLKPTSDGILEGFFHSFSLTLRPDHQLIEELNNPEQIVAVIGIDCALKQFDCSLLPHLLPSYNGADELLSVQVGHSEPNCIVQKTQKSQTILNIPSLKYARAFITKDHLDIAHNAIKVGDSLTIRYLDFNLVDNSIRATCLKKLMSLSYFSVHQAKLGEIIKCTVNGYKKDGFAVRISSQLTGFLPRHHLSDKHIRMPALAYKNGDEITARVFHIDHEKNKLILTVKKSLMNSTLPIVASINEFTPGMLVDSFVVKVSKFGLLVVMFNNLKGWVRKSEIPNDKDLTLSFNCGQVVQVRFLRAHPETGRIDLSMLTDDQQRNNEDDKSTKNLVNVEIGQIYQCTVKKVMKNGFNVRLLPINKAAFLTFEQLSDSREHRALLNTHFSRCEGKDIRTDVVVINTENQVVLVSRKNSLISAANDGRILIKKEDITPESQWLGWIIKVESFGIFVELPTGVVGLVPNKNISDLKPIGSEWKDLLKVGDTVEPKVIEFDATKPKKSLFTLKMSETYRAKEHMERGALGFLVNHLEERKFIKSLGNCEQIGKMEIGDFVDVKVTSQLEWGFTVQIGDSVPGFVRNVHLSAVPMTVDSVHKAVIIDIDLGQQSLEVCMTGSVVNSVKNRKNHCTKIAVDQHIKSDVLVFNNDFVVAMLLDHAHGNVVFIPTKRFWNDVAKEFCWIVNQRNRTVIKRALTSDSFIGSLAINEAIAVGQRNGPTKPVEEDSFRTLAKKIQLIVGQEYPVYFHSITKNKIFFYASKRQKCFCHLVDYSESLDELNQLLINPPALNSLMSRKFTVTNSGKADAGIAFGHFLKKEIIEERDQLCGLVMAVTKTKACTIKLPFDMTGLMENESNPPKVRSIVQCRVDKAADVGTKGRYILSLIRVSNYVEETEVFEDKTEQMDVDVVNTEKENEERISNAKKIYGANAEGMPEIVISLKERVKTDKSLCNVYKRVHNFDDENILEEEDSKPTTTKQRKVRLTAAEKEILLRESEKRIETGDMLKNPQTETEFELLVTNQPHCAKSWTRYMDFCLTEKKNVDKARSIAERAIQSQHTADTENRFCVFIKYIDLEIDEFVKTGDESVNEQQTTKFFALLERALFFKTKMVFVHCCKELRSRRLYDMAEKIAKRFVKESHSEMVAWLQLLLVRFAQKKFQVVKETLTNAERLLKADQYRLLLMKMAQVEIDAGNGSRAVQSLETLMMSRPKDEALKTKCRDILRKAGLLNQLQVNVDDE